MTKENKELVFKDISARIPYKCRVFYEYVDDLNGKTYGYSINLNTWCIDQLIADKAVIKPYLRSLASMTEDEKREYQAFFNYDGIDCPEEYIDWLNAHHFDYRGLIEKGLAIETPEWMYD